MPRPLRTTIIALSGIWILIQAGKLIGAAEKLDSRYNRLSHIAYRKPVLRLVRPSVERIASTGPMLRYSPEPKDLAQFIRDFLARQNGEAA